MRHFSNRHVVNRFGQIISTIVSGLVLALPAAAEPRTEVSLETRRTATTGSVELRVRSRSAAADWLVTARRRDSGNDEARLGVAFRAGGGWVRAGNLRDAVPALPRRALDPLDPRPATRGPALSTGRGEIGAAWMRERVHGAVGFAVARRSGGEAVAGARARWREVEIALVAPPRPLVAVLWSRSGSALRARAECWGERDVLEARVGIGSGPAGLLAAFRAEASRRWSAEAAGGLTVRHGGLRGLALRVRAAHRTRSTGETWRAAWRPLRSGESAEVREVRGRARWSVRAGRQLAPGWTAETVTESASLHPAEVRLELRRVRGSLRGGVRLDLGESLGRRGAAWLAHELGASSRIRLRLGWERERRASLDAEWSCSFGPAPARGGGESAAVRGSP